MVLSEADLIRSLLVQPIYLSNITQELIPDDTNELLVVSGRKGKSLEKNLNRIVGTSDQMFAERARELKVKAVTRTKEA